MDKAKEPNRLRNGIKFLLRSKSAGILLSILIGVCWIPAGFCLISFIAAETPQEAAARGYAIPFDWSAGVFDHGSFYEWYTIPDAPWLFAASLLTIIGGPAYSIWFHLRNRKPS